MTVEESKKALFQLHLQYMSHSPKERVTLYDDYIRRRNEIKNLLINSILEQKRKKTV